jgi:hypothetical protein
MPRAASAASVSSRRLPSAHLEKAAQTIVGGGDGQTNVRPWDPSEEVGVAQDER